MTIHNPTILVVDDSPNNLQATMACLRVAPESYTVLSAENGRIACEIAEREQPDLIVMDWLMPEMDGLEALEHLKRQPNTSEIPVIMLTGIDSPKRLEQAFRSGANDYIRSPIDKTELLARVRATLELAQSYKFIKEQNHRLEVRSKEILQQREKLEEQAVEIRIANVRLNQANKALEMKNSQLTELNYEKNELMGIAAHDLKNPISNIKMIAQILSNEADKLSVDEVKEYATDALNDSVRMFELVTKLLDINAIESGRIQFLPTEFDVAVVVQSVIENYHARASEKNLSLHFESAFDHLSVVADQSALVQVVDNLVSNAVKYSPLGKNITIRVRSVTIEELKQVSASDVDWLNTAQPLIAKTVARIEVEDEGPGISDADQKRLFAKFTKLSAKPTGGEHSTGLGLSIVKKMVHAMNGRIWCESTLDVGSTFIVELPQDFTMA
jgi:two-component system, sensor histidine kinase and response regulator